MGGGSMKSKPNKKTTRQEVRRVLAYWGNVERAISQRLERIGEIGQELAALYDLRPAPLSGMPHGTEISDPTVRAAERNDLKVARLEIQKQWLETEIEAMREKAASIERAVMCLPPLESEVIRLRYLRYGVARAGYWAKIAARVHVSEDHAKTLERHGVDRLAGRIKVD